MILAKNSSADDKARLAEFSAGQTRKAHLMNANPPTLAAMTSRKLGTSGTHGIPMPSPSLNEGVLGPVDSGDITRQGTAAAIAAARIAAHKAREAAQAIHTDMPLSEGAKHVRANEFTFKVTNCQLPVIDRARERLEAELTGLQKLTSAPPLVNDNRAVHTATEIRTALSLMTPSDRRKCLSVAVQEDDDATVSAVLSAPRYLANLKPAEVESLRAQWQQKRFPDELKRIELLEKDLDHLQPVCQLGRCSRLWAAMTFEGMI
jgi:hypothetical protein